MHNDHRSIRLSELILGLTLLGAVLDSSASQYPVSFRLEAGPNAVAVQFDVVSSLPGATLEAPRLENIGPHVVDSRRQPDGSYRFVIFSASNVPLNMSGTMVASLSVPEETVTGGFLSIRKVLAATASGSSVTPAPSPNALPVDVSTLPGSGFTALPKGGSAFWAVETFDPDGIVVSVTFFWNGASQLVDNAPPFTGPLSTFVAGDFSTAFEIKDNRGGLLRVDGISPLRIFDPSLTETWAGFQNVYFTDPSTASAGADPYGLGIPNLLAYALGLNPTLPDSSLYPSFVIQEAAGQRFAVYHADLADESGVTAGYQVSSSLAADSWSAADAALVTKTPLGNGYTRHELRLPLSGSPPSLFGRLVLSNP